VSPSGLATMKSLTTLISLSGVVLAQQTARSLTFKNSCSRDVWLSGVPGSAGHCSDGCETGTSCDTASGLCFWDVPTPNVGNWRVPSGRMSAITFPAWSNSDGAAWSGNVGFCVEGTSCVSKKGLVANATLCDSEGCEAMHVGNLAEFTLLKQSVDTYDISNIGGLSVPFSITPEKPNTDKNEPYTCANVGAIKSSTGLGESSWQFSPPRPFYVWVIPGEKPKTCTSDSDCSGEKCGLALSTTDQTTFSQVCGTLVGYWSQNAICKANPNTPATNCSAPIHNGAFPTTQGQLGQCIGDSGSCYQRGADSACCGCANWNSILEKGLVPPTTTQCANSNPRWVEFIQTSLEWLKEGAPNAYTYPFDDLSSTATCSNMEKSFNTQNYTIELCPGGVWWDNPVSVQKSPANAWSLLRQVLLSSGTRAAAAI